MIKFIITGLIIYFLYRVFFKWPSLNSGPQRPDRNLESNPEEEEGEYIDYEEID